MSAEVLQPLPFEASWGLHHALRIFYHLGELSPADWELVKLMLLPKQNVPKQWDLYRSMCLLSVLPKMCMGGAMEIARRWSHEVLGPRLHEPLLFGFERGSQREELLGILQGLVDEATEWGRPQFASRHQHRCETSIRLHPAGGRREVNELLGVSTDPHQGCCAGESPPPRERCCAWRWHFGAFSHGRLHPPKQSRRSQVIQLAALDMLRNRWSSRGTDAPLLGSTASDGRATS